MQTRTKRFMNRRMETNMEAKSGVVGGEVRRIHIIYFLSRTGRIEHPHLIRVHHVSRNGVHLRDVKRWLSDLRGKDMPNSFAWSYKRKYKAGFVWQDLLDDDLITPISDNEYVLKGSEIHSIPFDPISCGAKKVSPQKPEPLQDKHHEAPKGEATQQNRDTQMDISTKALSEIDEESGPLDSETSTTLTDESIKFEDEKHSRNSTVEEIHEQQSENVETTTFNPGSEMLKNNDDNKGTNLTEKTKNPPSDATNNATPNATDSPFTKSKSHHSSGASHVFRNLLTCGAVNTNDSAMVRINRVNKNSNGVSSNKSGNTADQICKTDTKCQFQSARKSFSGMKNSKKNEVTSQKKVSAAYKPVSGPNCSQCGKEFRPEKMHAHMKSCRGLKAMAKNSSAPTASAAEKATTRRSTGSASKEGTPGYFLTH